MGAVRYGYPVAVGDTFSEDTSFLKVLPDGTRKLQFGVSEQGLVDDILGDATPASAS